MADTSNMEQVLKEVGEGYAELNDDELDAIVGGTISPVAGMMLKMAMSKYRDQGMSLDEVVAAIPGLYDSLSSDPAYAGYLAQTDVTEITEFVKNNW